MTLNTQTIHTGDCYYVMGFITFTFIALWSVITFWDYRSRRYGYENLKLTIFVLQFLVG